MEYIQFIGTQRSGSNLLRVILNQEPEISAPHPPHILKVFFPLLGAYGDLSDINNFNEVARDVCEWVVRNPVPWENFNPDSSQIAKSCQEFTLLELFSKIYQLKARQDKAKFWCCKSMESVYYAAEIEASKLKPFYIYLFRDGRDVALSFKKAVVGPKHIYHLALKWKEEQERSLALLKKLPESRFIIVRYEDLILFPNRVLTEIFNKLGIEYNERVLSYYKSKESLSTASSGEMWKNLTKPIISNNSNKFLAELSAEEINIFERIAGSMLRNLGYELFAKQSTGDDRFTEGEIEAFNKENTEMMREVLKSADANELIKREPQEALLAQIKDRLHARV